MLDVLHTADQGVCAHAIGEVMQQCGEHIGPNNDGRMKAMAAMLKDWYPSQPKCTYRTKGKLTAERLKSFSGFLHLKGRPPRLVIALVLM